MKRIIILSLSLFLLFILADSAEAALSCSFNSCPSGGIYVLRISASYNAHTELPSQSNYSNYVCCSGISGTSCSGGTAFLKLSALTNAHVEQTNYFNYSNNACLTPSAGETISCNYSTSCSAGYTCLASISGATNAHIAQCGVYSTQVCCIASTVEQFQFTLNLDPTSRSAFRDSQTFTTVQLNRTQGTAENVTFNPLTLPSGVTYQFSPSNCTPNDSCSSTLTFFISASAQLVTNYNVNVCGTATGGYSACQNFYLTITDSGTQIIAPSVTTNAATSITTNSATLNGALNSMGNVSFCLVWFEWGPTTSLGNVTSVQNRSSTGSFSADITGLTAGQTYYFKAFAKNGGSW